MPAVKPSADAREPVRLAQVAQDRAQVADLDRSGVLALLAELHAIEGVLVDRLLVLDAEDQGDDELWTIEETAEFLRLRPEWIRRRPNLPFLAHVSGGAVRTSKKKLFAWIARRTGGRP
jgi:hypothetical protein